MTIHGITLDTYRFAVIEIDCDGARLICSFRDSVEAYNYAMELNNCG